MNNLTIGLPKGSLQEATFAIMQKAGFQVQLGSRSYVPIIDDPELKARLIRAQEISRYVELGMLDAGITGHDWIVENDSDVVEVVELLYATPSETGEDTARCAPTSLGAAPGWVTAWISAWASS